MAYNLIKFVREPVGETSIFRIQFNLRDSNLDRRVDGIQREGTTSVRRFIEKREMLAQFLGKKNCIGDVSRGRFHHLASLRRIHSLQSLTTFSLLYRVKFWKSILTPEWIPVDSGDGNDSKWQGRETHSGQFRKRQKKNINFLQLTFSSNNKKFYYFWCAANNVESITWFPLRIQDLDLFPSNVLSQGMHLDADHPGFNDAVYRERRKKIVDVAIKYKQ